MNKHSKFRTIIFVLAIWLFLSIYSFPLFEAPQSPYADAIKAFEKYVVEQMAIEKVPGISVGFMKDDFIWTKGFGYADLENLALAKPESSYRLASVTKTITALAILKLVEEGKIDLDAEVQTYVPYFPKKKWPVTVRLLLGHLGGISHYRNYDEEGHIKVHKNTKQALDIFKGFDLVAEPGTRYNYSSYGFNLLGAVIEGASGQSYGDFIREHIFNPLGMENSRMDDPVDLIPNRVRGYRNVDGEIKNSEYVDVSSRFAGGGTRSTVIDLLKYAKGIFDGKILKEESYREMFTSMVLLNQHFTGYGMGWSVIPIRGHFSVNHGGSQPETRTYIVLLPKERLAVALCSNMEGLDLRPYYKSLIELLLDEDIDSSAYASGMTKQAMDNACADIFSYGMSYYEQHGSYLSKGDEELKEAFSFFNTNVNEKALKNNYKETKEKIDDGIHPASKQAFTKVGSFMAFALEKETGKDWLKNYYKNGPLAFFSDYIKISQKNTSYKNFRFEKNFSKLISRWEKDWKATYIDFVRHLTITPSTDFDEIGPMLKKTFSGAELYPDFTPDISRAAEKLLEKNETEKTFKILNLSTDIYPNSPFPYSSLAFTHIWTGNIDEARLLFKKAYDLNPYHSAVSVNQFFGYGNRLAEAKKLEEAIALGIIATELYPKEARIYVEIGNGFAQTKQKEKAIEYYKKALEIDPKLESVKKRLEKLEKENQK